MVPGRLSKSILGGKMFNRFTVLIALLILSTILFSSCAKREDRVVADVGGKLITVAEMEKIFRIGPDWTPQRADSARIEVLDGLIENKLLVLEAERMGYRDEEGIMGNLEYLKEKAMSIQLYKKMIEDRVEVKEGEMKWFYDRVGESVKLRHILVATEEEADSVYALLTKKVRKSFDVLAKELSIHGSTKDKGGDLGWITWGTGLIPEELEMVAFSMGIGEISRPVKSWMGYHVVKVDDKRKTSSKKQPYEEVKERIRDELEKAKMRKLSTQYLDDLKEKAKIQVDEEVLGILVRAPFPAAVTEEDRQKVLVRFSLGEWTIARVLEEAGKASRQSSFNEFDSARRYVVDYLIVNELIQDEAKKLHLDELPAVKLEVESEVEKRLIRRLSGEVIDASVEAPSEDELVEYYSSHIKDYTEPPSVRVSYIQVKTEEEAKEILGSLRRGTDFARLAEERSAHPSKDQGGDLGFLVAGMFPGPEIERVAFALKPGDISDVIKIGSQFGVIKVTEKKGERVEPFEEAKDRVVHALIEEKREKAREEIVSRVRKETKIVINYRNLRLFGAAN